MKTKVILSIFLVLAILKLNGQVVSKSPGNINEAIRALDKKLSPETKNRIARIASDSLIIWYDKSKTEFDVMDGWFSIITPNGIIKDGRLGEYYKEKGLAYYYDMIEVVLRTYQSELKGTKAKHDEILRPFQLRQKDRDEETIRSMTDTSRNSPATTPR